MQCELCEEGLGVFAIREENHVFCCHGCLAVYKILESQNQLASKKGHPLIAQAIGFGLISNPHLIEEIRRKEEKEVDCKKKWVFELLGMWCPACATFIQLVVAQKKGILKIVVDYVTDLSSIEYDPTVVAKEDLKKWIQELGYGVQELSSTRREEASLTLPFAIAAFSALNVMMFAYPLYTTYFSFENEGMRPILAWISLLLTLPVIGYSARPFYRRMWIQAKQGIMGMEALVGIGVTSAFILSLYEMAQGTYHIYFDTIGVLIAFLLLGKMMESKAKFSTKEALYRLHLAVPKKGRKRSPDGSFAFVPVKEINPKDEVAVYGGERIVLDGLITWGEGTVDESIVTGESVPIFKKRGDILLAGSILQQGTLHYETTSKEENSTLKHIIKLIENEIVHKTGYTRAVDRVVKWFTPLVIAVACFTFMGVFVFFNAHEAFSRFMAVLLIACPCAIGIASPLVESRLIHQFAEKGALIRNRSLLSLLPRITHFVLDKTGTVTEGRFDLMTGLEGLSPFQSIRLKTAVSKSIHPIAKAIDKALQADVSDEIQLQEVAGKGIIGKDRFGTFYLGSQRFMEEIGVLVPEVEKTVVFYVEEKILVATILLGDKIKEEAGELIRKLKPLTCILLSGDHEREVGHVAKELKFDAWHAEHTPLEKQVFIQDLKSKGAQVAMVGDGINDAPSLAKADVGISVVSAADISIQISDLLLTTPSLSVLPELISLSKRGQKLIHQNLFWAFFYNGIGIALAILGILTPLFASFAMAASSLMVLFNAKRI